MTTKKTAPTPERVEVTLIAEHTHAGKLCKPGEKITVTKNQAEWLKSRRVIE